MSACDICSNKCFGIEGYDGSCCTVEERDWIMGPIHDAEEFIKKLSNKLGRAINRDDIFIDYEEGKSLFPLKPVWQNKDHYPAFRIDLNNKRLPCIFYNTTVKSCMVYSIRPKTCRDFKCDYLKEQTKDC